MTQPFIYIIGWTELNAWYIGAKWAKGCSPLDLWTTYFTSSKLVSQLRDEYGEPDYLETFVVGDGEATRGIEADLIKGSGLHLDSKWINRGTFKTYYPAPGERADQMRVRWADPDYKDQVRAALLSTYADPEVREKVSAANRKRFEDPTNREKTSATMKATLSDPAIYAAHVARARTAWRDPAKKEQMLAKRRATVEAKKKAALSSGLGSE